jgi:ferredoxin
LECEKLADHVPYVAEDDCIACGACEEICPEVFTVNETLGFAQVMNPLGAPVAKIQEAVEACPVNCIHWADEPE